MPLHKSYCMPGVEWCWKPFRSYENCWVKFEDAWYFANRKIPMPALEAEGNLPPPLDSRYVYISKELYY